ncbi:MAG: ribosome maturation factor [Haliscomenobacter sp.]|nr:ribosome maturation factor [Haliscomenobacter sp.]MBP9077487.1 ribosome maturation factor [Haliscomenobacter sp.]MBP9874182.1 ribosome maturation factor [Haliscomenobacter sp.]
MEITEKIDSLLQEKFLEEAFADCFIVEIKLGAGNKLEVFADSDSGMTFEKCQRISRYLEEHIDAGGWLGLHYVLEVSSPGISRPLQFWRQYPRNIGRQIEVTLQDGTKRKGVLQAVHPETIVLSEEISRKEGKKTIKEKVETAIPFGHIEKTFVKVSF